MISFLVFPHGKNQRLKAIRLSNLNSFQNAFLVPQGTRPVRKAGMGSHYHSSLAAKKEKK
jgi:hypothetical protein